MKKLEGTVVGVVGRSRCRRGRSAVFIVYFLPARACAIEPTSGSSYSPLRAVSLTAPAPAPLHPAVVSCPPTTITIRLSVRRLVAPAALDVGRWTLDVAPSLPVVRQEWD